MKMWECRGTYVRPRVAATKVPTGSSKTELASARASLIVRQKDRQTSQKMSGARFEPHCSLFDTLFQKVHERWTTAQVALRVLTITFAIASLPYLLVSRSVGLSPPTQRRDCVLKFLILTSSVQGQHIAQQ